MARRNSAAPDFIVTINIANAARSGDLCMLKKAGERISRIRRGKIGKMVSDFCDDDGEGPLHYAARLAHAEICEYLIKTLKMDANLAAHQSGKTPLCFAASSGDQNTVESLINCGADLHVKDAKGLTPLHDAVIGANPGAIEVLLSKGVEVDAQSFTGSPLLLATLRGDLSCTKVLLDHNANPNVLLCGIVTPLLTVVMNNEKCIFHPQYETKEIVELLIKAGADMNKTQVLGLAYHSKELVEYLLEFGANPNLPDKSGRLPIEVAAMMGAYEVVEILFPVTSPIPTVPDWSIKGLISHIASKSFKKEKKVLSKKRLVELKQKIKDLLFRKEYLAALVLCSFAIEEDPENASIYYAKRCLCWMHLGNAMRDTAGFMYMLNATTDADLCEMSDVIHTLGEEHLSEMISFRMFLKLSLA